MNFRFKTLRPNCLMEPIWEPVKELLVVSAVGAAPPVEDRIVPYNPDDGEPAESRLRGPYRKFRDAAAGSEHPSDWSRFDVTHSLKDLRSSHEPTIIRTLRKLHLRWWHAGPTNMTSVLRNAGIPEEVISYIPDVISTCRECRKWAPKAKDTQPSVSLAMNFNEVVENRFVVLSRICCTSFYLQSDQMACCCGNS